MNSITITEIQEILENAGCQTSVRGSRLFVTGTPNGGSGRFGFLVDGDDGSTGSCQGITKRKGEISAYIRAGINS